MSQHDHRTQYGPSIAITVALGVCALAAIGTGCWIIYGPPDPRNLGGGALGMLLFVSWSAAVAGRLVERRTVLDRQRRERDAEREEQEYLMAERAGSTGTWTGEQGQVLTLRYETGTGFWYAHGWLGDFFQLPEETRWTWGLITLVDGMTEREVTGELTPVDDEGTREVRARLGLPPWPPVATVPMHPRTMPDLQVERTRVIDPAPYRPSPAALAPLAVPVFRSETERAAWAARNEVPTEFLPRVQDRS